MSENSENLIGRLSTQKNKTLLSSFRRSTGKTYRRVSNFFSKKNTSLGSIIEPKHSCQNKEKTSNSVVGNQNVQNVIKSIIEYLLIQKKIF